MRVGWIVMAWTGRVWSPCHDTGARTRGETIRKWREPWGHRGWIQYEKRRRKGYVKVVPLMASEPEPPEERA